MTNFRSSGSFWVIGYLSWLTMSRVSVVKSRVINRCKHFDEVHCLLQENEVFCVKMSIFQSSEFFALCNEPEYTQVNLSFYLPIIRTLTQMIYTF